MEWWFKDSHNWKSSMSKAWLALLVFVLLVAGCATRGSQPQMIRTSGDLPEGVFASAGKKFLLWVQYQSPSEKELVSGEENSVLYHIALANLAPVSAPDYRIQISYDMPDMDMGGPKAPTLTEIKEGTLRASYVFSMGRTWRFTYQLYRGNDLIDTLTRDAWVKE